MCSIVQRIAWSPQLCHSLLSNAKQEINVACCVFACVCLCVWKWERVRVRECLQPPLAASVHSWKSVCVRKTEMCLLTGQRQTHARESRAVPPYLQINVPAQFSSQSNQRCWLCFNKITTGLKTLCTNLDQFCHRLWIHSVFREDFLNIKVALHDRKSVTKGAVMFYCTGKDLHFCTLFYLWSCFFSCNTVTMHINYDTLPDFCNHRFTDV